MPLSARSVRRGSGGVGRGFRQISEQEQGGHMWKVAWGVVLGLLLWFVVLPVVGVTLMTIALAVPDFKFMAARIVVGTFAGGVGVAIGQYYRRKHQTAS